MALIIGVAVGWAVLMVLGLALMRRVGIVNREGEASTREARSASEAAAGQRAGD